MALKKCKECGQAVSTDANACPHCGKRYTNEGLRRSLRWGAGAGLLVVIPSLWLGNYADAGVISFIAITLFLLSFGGRI